MHRGDVRVPGAAGDPLEPLSHSGYARRMGVLGVSAFAIAISIVAFASEARSGPSPVQTPPPKVVPPTIFLTLRISGRSRVVPDPSTRHAIRKAGKRAVSSWKLCIDKKGSITTLRLLRSSTFRAYDREVERALHRWRFRPYRVYGTPMIACTAVSQIYAPGSPLEDPSRPRPKRRVPFASLRKIYGSSSFDFATDLRAWTRRQHRAHVAGRFELCLDKEGYVTDVRVVQTAESTIIDADVLADLRSWQFQPARVGKTAVAACTTVSLESLLSAHRSDGDGHPKGSSASRKPGVSSDSGFSHTVP